MTEGFLRLMLATMALIVVTTTVHAAPTSFVAILKGSEETPPNSSTAIGNGLVVLNSTENMITVSLKFSGL